MRFIERLIEKRAIKVYAENEFIREYGFFIAMVILIKLATILFSVFASQNIVYSYLLKEWNNDPLAFYVSLGIIIFFIETPANLSLSIFYKRSLRGDIRWAIIFVLISLLFFGISFILSSKGFAQHQVKKTDNSTIIVDQYNIDLEELKTAAESKKIQLDSAIKDIKLSPLGWSGGKRIILLPEQQATIKGYNEDKKQINIKLDSDIQKLNEIKNSDLKENNGNVIITEKRFYYYSASIMLVQLIMNGLIMFFYSRIYHDKKKEQLAKDTVQKFASDIADTTDQLIKDNISQQYLRYMSALSFQLGETDGKTIPVNAKTDKKIGFVKQTDDERNNITVITEDIKTGGTVKNTLAAIPCKFCGSVFQQRIYTQLFCCDEHRQKWHRENKGFDLNLYKKRKK